MNTIKIAALATLLASAAAFAQQERMSQQDETQKRGAVPEFRTLDINGDGQVSEQEAQANATVWEKFAQLDTDKNGSLSAREYAKAKAMDKMPKDSEKY